MTPQQLRGWLDVLLGVDAELHAIAAPSLRVERNRRQIARVRLALAAAGGRTGDPAGASAGQRP